MEPPAAFVGWTGTEEEINAVTVARTHPSHFLHLYHPPCYFLAVRVTFPWQNSPSLGNTVLKMLLFGKGADLHQMQPREQQFLLMF